LKPSDILYNCFHAWNLYDRKCWTQCQHFLLDKYSQCDWTLHDYNCKNPHDRVVHMTTQVKQAEYNKVTNRKWPATWSQ
jgi:hypothetical protein